MQDSPLPQHDGADGESKVVSEKPQAEKRAATIPIADLVLSAIKTLNGGKGSSLVAIKKFIRTDYPAAQNRKYDLLIGRFVKKSIASGILVCRKGSTLAGSFKLSPNGLKIMKNKLKVKDVKKVQKKKKTNEAKPNNGEIVEGDELKEEASTSVKTKKKAASEVKKKATSEVKKTTKQNTEKSKKPKKPAKEKDTKTEKDFEQDTKELTIPVASGNVGEKSNRSRGKGGSMKKRKEDIPTEDEPKPKVVKEARTTKGSKASNPAKSKPTTHKIRKSMTVVKLPRNKKAPPTIPINTN